MVTNGDEEDGDDNDSNDEEEDGAFCFFSVEKGEEEGAVRTTLINRINVGEEEGAVRTTLINRINVCASKITLHIATVSHLFY